MQTVQAPQTTRREAPTGTVGRLGGIVFSALCLALYVAAVVAAALS
jgi:hypothetical protein